MPTEPKDDYLYFWIKGHWSAEYELGPGEPDDQPVEEDEDYVRVCHSCAKRRNLNTCPATEVRPIDKALYYTTDADDLRQGCQFTLGTGCLNHTPG